MGELFIMVYFLICCAGAYIGASGFLKEQVKKNESLNNKEALNYSLAVLITCVLMGAMGFILAPIIVFSAVMDYFFSKPDKQ